MNPAQKRPPSLFLSLLPLLILIALLAGNVYLFKDEGLSGPNQIALLVAASVSFAIAMFLGHSARALLEKVYDSIRTALPALLILLMVGALAE